MNRREFIAGTLLSGLCGCRTSDGAGGTDGSLSVLISDPHVGGTGSERTFQKPRLERVIGEILAMSPRPKRVICFGDIAYLTGRDSDYAMSKPIFRRLVDAGIDVHLTMGNHDRRSNFLRHWPEYAERPLVPGRLTQVISLGGADLVLLDTLKGTDDRAEDDAGPGEGTIDPAQLEWFKGFVAQAARPFLVGSHHFGDLSAEGVRPISIPGASPHFAGWIFGHEHEWRSQMAEVSWGRQLSVPTQALPSTGHYGDIGYVTMRTTDRGAELTLHQSDYFFVTPRSNPPAGWMARVRDNDGQRRHFLFGSTSLQESR